MKKRITLTESKLRRVVEESVKAILNEVNGYSQTIAVADKQFNQNTIGGRIRSFFNPKKAAQYNRIKQNAKEMGAEAQNKLNTMFDNLPWEQTRTPLGWEPDWFEYAVENGLTKGLGPRKYSPYSVCYHDETNERARYKMDREHLGNDLYDKKTKPLRDKIKKYGKIFLFTNNIIFIK